MSRRLRRLLFAIGALAVIALVAVVAYGRILRGPDDPPPLPAMVDPLMPDLIMAPIEDIGATATEIGTRRLRSCTAETRREPASTLRSTSATPTTSGTA